VQVRAGEIVGGVGSVGSVGGVWRVGSLVEGGENLYDLKGKDGDVGSMGKAIMGPP
jgi:hypothetical protein